MSLKGKIFTADDLSASAKRKLKPAAIEQWAAAQTARHKVVAIDASEPAGRQQIIAEELDQRAINKLSPKARRVAGMMMRADQAVRAEVVTAFRPDGSLKHPFKMV